ncbi:tetratricopeptide repeat protein, partial [candidate division KSB1 bacterium]
KRKAIAEFIKYKASDSPEIVPSIIRILDKVSSRNEEYRDKEIINFLDNMFGEYGAPGSIATMPEITSLYKNEENILKSIEECDTLEDVIECAKASRLKTLSNHDIIKVLGRGGFYTVFLGYNRKEKNYEAIRIQDVKDLSMHILDNMKKPLEQFKDEDCAQVGKLKHTKNDYIAAVYSVDEEDGKLIMRREYFEKTLADLLEEKGKLDLGYVINIIEQTGSAVKEALEKGVHHGDLKPENIGITKEGDVRVIDFGRMSSITYNQAKKSINQGSTKTKAPELYRLTDEVIAQMDDGKYLTFSLSATMYLLIADKWPFLYRKVGEDEWDSYQEEVLQDIQKKLVDEDSRFLYDKENCIKDRRLRKILKKGMTFNQDERTSLEDFCDQIGSYRKRFFPEKDERRTRLAKRVVGGVLAASALLILLTSTGYIDVKSELKNMINFYEETDPVPPVNLGRIDDARKILFWDSKTNSELFIRSSIDIADYDTAIRAINAEETSLLTKFPENKDDINLFAAKNIGQIKIYQRDYASAITLLDTAAELARKLHVKGDNGRDIMLADTLMELGNAYREMGDYEKALSLMKESNAILDDLELKLKKGTLNKGEEERFFHTSNWARQKYGYTLLLFQGCSDKQAKGILDKVYKKFDDNQIIVGEAWTSMFLGMANYCDNRFQDASGYFSHANSIFSGMQREGKEGIIHSLFWQGKTLTKMDRYDEAIVALSSSLDCEQGKDSRCGEKKQGQRPSLEADIMASLGIANINKGDYEGGLDHIKKAIIIATEGDAYREKKDFRNTIMAIYPACALVKSLPESVIGSELRQLAAEIDGMCKVELQKLYSAAENEGIDVNILKKEAHRMELD